MITRQSTKFGVASKGFAKAHKSGVWYDFSLTVIPRDEVSTAGTTEQQTTQDVVMEVESGAVIDHEADIEVQAGFELDVQNIEWWSSDESILTVADGKVSRVSDGT